MDKILTHEGKKAFEALFCNEPIAVRRKTRHFTVEHESLENGKWETDLVSHANEELKTWNAVWAMRAWRRIEILKDVRDTVVFDVVPEQEKDERLSQLIEEFLDSAVFLLKAMQIPDHVIAVMDDEMREAAITVQSGLNGTGILASADGKVDTRAGKVRPIFSASP